MQLHSRCPKSPCPDIDSAKKLFGITSTQPRTVGTTSYSDRIIAQKLEIKLEKI